MATHLLYFIHLFNLILLSSPFYTILNFELRFHHHVAAVALFTPDMQPKHRLNIFKAVAGVDTGTKYGSCKNYKF